MSKPRILIVEDDRDWQDIYRRFLSDEDYAITAARKLSTAMALLEEQSFDVVITDLKMLGGKEEFSGFGILEQAKATNPSTQVIVITGFPGSQHAQRSMDSGAYVYITKDRDLRQQLPLAVQGALDPESERSIIGTSASMQELFKQIASAAESDVNVLIYGEESTGKQLIAHTIHRRSQRRDRDFLIADCGRVSELVLQRELFGYEGHRSKFELAKGGTVFLDSIGDLDPELQKRLIGVVCDRIIERADGEPIPVAARIIASTDKDLKAMLSGGRFQRRLFYALNECTISVPPLRERKDGDDIAALAALFLRRHRLGRNVQFSPEAIELLCRYDYPGNVQELESAVKHALTMARGQVIGPEHLRPEIRTYEPPKRGRSRKQDEKDPATILRVCPLNLGACSKREEIVRLYSSRRIFANVSYAPEYAEYEHAIRFTLEKYNLVPVLSKDYLEPGALLCNICKLIQTCKYGVTDISVSGGNVLYEMGLMHAIGIPCAILKDRQSALSADIQGLLFLEYDSPDLLAKELSRWIESQVKEAELSPEVVDSTEKGLSLEEERTAMKKLLGQRKRQLLEIEEHCAKFSDPRNIPPDLEENRRQLKAEVARIEALLAQLPSQ